MNGRVLRIGEVEKALEDNLEVLEEYEKNQEYVQKHYEELQEMYGGQWISVLNGGKEIVSDEDGDKVLEETRKICEELERDFRGAYIGRVEKEDEVWILPFCA